MKYRKYRIHIYVETYHVNEAGARIDGTEFGIDDGGILSAHAWYDEFDNFEQAANVARALTSLSLAIKEKEKPPHEQPATDSTE